MRVFLAGGTGMVGRNIREATGAAAHEVLAPARQELDLFDPSAVLRYIDTHQPDLVIHAAGRVGGIQANMREPVNFLIDNIDLGRNVVMSAMQAGVPRLLNLGSSCMYPRDAENPLREETILTGAPEPTNEGYALAKIAIARLCRYINQEHPNLSYKTLIPSNLYGRHDHYDSQGGHMVPMVIAKLHLAKQNGAAEADIWGDGTPRREYMYAGDLADAVWAAIDGFDAIPDVMNVGPGEDHSVNDYYAAIAEVVGFSGRFVHDLSKPSGTKQKLLDVGRMKAWGFSPRHAPREGMAMAYQYYLRNVANIK
jgi:GDP-L-fucose synthase